MTLGFVFPVSSLEAAALAMLKDPSTNEYRAGITAEDVVSSFGHVRALMTTGATEETLDELVQHWVQALTADSGGNGGPVVKNGHIPWLQQSKTEIEWRRWLAYRQMLSQNGRSAAVLDRLDQFSDDILDLAGDPRPAGAWTRRGLIIGDVQSGKTQNFVALMNKAADVGYRIIIVLSGNTEYLRQQTHSRVDEGFIGRDTTLTGSSLGARIPRDVNIGIGKIDPDIANVTSLTTALMDYLQVSRTAGDVALPTSASPPLVFVIKKNKHVLEAVQGWARAKSGGKPRIDLPLLLIDDESDYASINTSDEADDPTAINSAIRKLLGLFTRSSYLAITATPFANIFIDDEAKACLTETGEELPDLFPEDYIYPLEAPTNYVGIRKVFGDGGAAAKTVVPLTDAAAWLPPKHKKSSRPAGLPESLSEAIRTYLLANALMDHQLKAPVKRSMLINVTRFTDVQNHVADSVSEELFQYKTAIQLHAAAHRNRRPHPLISRLEETYERQYGGHDITWDSALANLSAAVSDIKVKVYNSAPGGGTGDFAEEAPTRQIAIGGDLLSRGLTLDGLVVSYFHRSVAAADTMMQMARWFGYRDGYQGLCRVWIGESAANDYRFIANAVEELRAELFYMRRSKMIPRDFGLAVKQHPDSLLITARNKSRHTVSTEKEINLLGRVLETTKLSSDVEIQKNNHDAIIELLDAAGAHACSIDKTRRGYCRINAVPKELVAAALGRFATAPDEVLFSGASLQQMVRNSAGEKFQTWDVVVVNGSTKRNSPLQLGPLASCYPVERQMLLRPLMSRDGDRRGASLWISGKRGRLAGTDDLQKVLSQELEEQGIQLHLDRVATAGQDAPSTIPETSFYYHLPRPQILIYPLLPSGKGDEKTRIETEELADLAQEEKESLVALAGSLEQAAPVIALKIALPKSSFSPTDRNGRVRYLVNSVGRRFWVTDYEPLV